MLGQNTGWCILLTPYIGTLVLSPFSIFVNTYAIRPTRSSFELPIVI
jgi:hypothetical protein